MEHRPLEVTMISAMDLKDPNLFGKMKSVFRKMSPYVVGSLSGGDKGDKRHEAKRTPVHKRGGTSPHWGHLMTFTVGEAEVLSGSLKLKFEVMAEKTLGGDKEVGWVEVPLMVLLEQQDQAGGGGDGKPKLTSYRLRLPSGTIKGVLEFYYKFGERFTVEEPPAARYLPQGHGHAPTAAPGYGNPPPSYGDGYPPAGYGNGAPPAAYHQEPPRRSGGGNFVLGLHHGAHDGVRIGGLISDVSEAFGFNAGFEDGGDM